VETKSREETSTKNGRSEVTNRRDGLGLGQSYVNGGARLRQCGAAEVVRMARRRSCGGARGREGAATAARAATTVGGVARLRRSSGYGGVAQLLEETRWRTGDRGAREVTEALQSSGLGHGLTAAAADGKGDGKNRSGRTVKRAQIRFPSDDQTHRSTDRARWSSVRSESSKLLA
jgi:hypothetical protein